MRGTVRGGVRLCLRPPPPAIGDAGDGVTTARTLPHSGADTPRERPTSERYIIYTRAQARGENVLHRAASNDVDNFSVDNPLWITTAAGGRSLRGRRRRVCGGSVNVAAAGANIIRREAEGYARPPMASWENCERRGGNINADAANAEVFAGGGCSQGASFVPMAAISRRWRGGRIYNSTRTRERLRRKCVKPADLTTHSPPKTCSRPRTATRPARALSHSLPEHFSSPSPRRRTPADLTTHPQPKTFARPRTAPSPFPAAPRCLRLCSASGTKKRHRTVDVRCRMSRSTVVAVGHWGW